METGFCESAGFRFPLPTSRDRSRRFALRRTCRNVQPLGPVVETEAHRQIIFPAALWARFHPFVLFFESDSCHQIMKSRIIPQRIDAFVVVEQLNQSDLVVFVGFV